MTNKSDMADTIIQCPECGADIPVSQVLQEQLRQELEQSLRAEHRRRLREAAAKAERRARQQLNTELQELQAQLAQQTRVAEEARAMQEDLRGKARQLAEREAALQKEIEQSVEARLEKTLKVRLDEAVAVERARARQEEQLWKAQLEAQRKKVAEARAMELKLREEKLRLEEEARAMELEIQRRIDAERQRIESRVRERLETEQYLKLKEKEKQIHDLQRALEDARRRSTLASQELQGEALELEIQSVLEREFPSDHIAPVPKGMRGADIVQTVRDERGVDCGAIVWESKNTKNWQPAWLAKLRQDQRALGAPLAVIISVALPLGIRGFGRVDGVWIADPRHWPALAMALREQLIQVAWARSAAQGREEKLALLYDYFAGDEFRLRVENIVEAFQAMQAQIDKERRLLTRHWAEREKQLQRVIGSTTTMYGELRGIIGSAMVEIPALDVEVDSLPEQGEQESVFSAD